MKKAIIAVVAGLAVSAGVMASAATLGGVTPQSLGASEAVVASCDSDGVDVDYATSWNSASNNYQLDKVVISGTDAACDGLDIDVAVSNSTGSIKGETTGTVAANPGATTLTFGSGQVMDSEEVDRVSIQING